MDDLLLDKVLHPTLSAIFILVIISLEWVRYFSPLKSPPILATLIVVILIAFYGVRVFTSFSKIKNYRLGRDGERIVGQELESLRTQGARVFHDIEAGRFNIDHLLICSRGIYVIETKTFRKPINGNAAIRFDGETIYMDERPLTPNPLKQARMNAKWIQRLLRQSAGREFAVKPVVVFPGWYVDSKKITIRPDAWVLNHLALSKFLPNEPTTLSEEDVHLASFHIEQYVRRDYGFD